MKDFLNKAFRKVKSFTSATLDIAEYALWFTASTLAVAGYAVWTAALVTAVATYLYSHRETIEQMVQAIASLAGV